MQRSTTPQSRQWADTPYPLIETPMHRDGKTEKIDPFMQVASEMCVVHNAVLRGLNSIYIQGPNLLPKDYADFIGYSLCWYEVIHEHHSSEEEQFFPGIEDAVGEKGLLDENVEQHRSFHKGLEDFKTYLDSLSGNEVSFNATHLNNIITSFAPALHSHLTTEVEDLLALNKYSSKLPIENLWREEGKRSVSAMTKFSALPFFFLNLDRTFEDHIWKNWPAIPGPARWVITHAFTTWHPGYWKFASCDASGVPKDLYASVSER